MSHILPEQVTRLGLNTADSGTIVGEQLWCHPTLALNWTKICHEFQLTGSALLARGGG